MKPIMKRIMMAGVLALSLAVTGGAFAFGPCDCASPEQGNPPKSLRLTPEQTVQLQELRRNFNRETAQLHQAVLSKRIELRSLWEDPKSDPQVILEKEREVARLQDEMRERAVRMRLETRRLVPPGRFSRTPAVRDPGRPCPGYRTSFRGVSEHHLRCGQCGPCGECGGCGACGGNW
jgi:Spy/CpxP family protein refolding chaperone